MPGRGLRARRAQPSPAAFTAPRSGRLIHGNLAALALAGAGSLLSISAVAFPARPNFTSRGESAFAHNSGFSCRSAAESLGLSRPGVFSAVRSPPEGFSCAALPKSSPNSLEQNRNFLSRSKFDLGPNRVLRLRGFGATATNMASSAADTAPDEDEQCYKRPPKEIADLVDADPSPSTLAQPSWTGSENVLLLQPSSMLELTDLAKEELKLGGARFHPDGNVPSRRIGYRQISILKRSTGEEIPVAGLPKGKIYEVKWSPAGDKVALTVKPSDGSSLQLYMFTPEFPTAVKVSDRGVSSITANSFIWRSGGDGLLVNTIPASRGDPPPTPLLPRGPQIQANKQDEKAPGRTYQDLLKNEHDDSLFEHYTTTQLVAVDIDAVPTADSPTAKTTEREMGPPCMLSSYKDSPDGKYLLFEYYTRPFSRQVLYNRFPLVVKVLSMEDGSGVRTIETLPLAENIPIGRDARRSGGRGHVWRADLPSTLYWYEAQDGGDPKTVVEHRDVAYTLDVADAGSAKVELFRTEWRLQGTTWGDDQVALVRESEWKTRRVRLWQINPSKRTKHSKPLLEYSMDDGYNHPGSASTRMTQRNTFVLRRDKKGRAFFSGTGGSDQGDRPFLHLRPLFDPELVGAPEAERDETVESASAGLEYTTETNAEGVRVWRCAEGVYESTTLIVEEEDGEFVTLLTSRETQVDPPNMWERRVAIDPAQESPAPKQVTFFPHPQPSLLGVKKELIKYKREADGLDLSGMLYLPPGYEESQGPIPTILWAYPREYKNSSSASQVKGSPHRFVRVPPTSPLMFLVRGIAVLDNPAMPIVGEDGKEENDQFVPQLVSCAEAAVQELQRRGVADSRVGIGGHSYGGFMAANLLAHSTLFRVGVGRSGAYNRLLTPFGFQSEERTLWEAPDAYLAMSPFMHADKIDRPLLLIHGEADNNPGTFPMQSERFYQALKGLGKECRLVLLPLESHSYAAKENVLHMLNEIDQWLLQHLVPQPQPAENPAAESPVENQAS